MGLFSKSTRNSRHARASGATDTTMTDGGYNNRGYDNDVNHSRYDRSTPGLSRGTHHDVATHSVSSGDYNDSVNNGVNNRGYDDTSGRRGRGLGRNKIGKHNNEKGHRSKTPRNKRPLFDIHSGYYNRRPSFGTWLKYTWLDILTMIIMGAIGLGVYYADPAPSRSFPVTFLDGTIVYPQFAYPLRNEIIPIWAAAMLAALVPIVVFLIMQIRIKSFWDVNNAIIGLLYSLIGAAVFQVFVKWLIGGLRPHFLEVCAPDLNRITQYGGEGFGNIMFKPDICTGDRNQINDSLESMPSGHSTAAWAGFLYLYFYLNAKLKVFSNHHPAMWKLIALYAPLLGATLITGVLTIDEFHNWYDCLAGAIIGSVFAISAYRMVYASVWDFRFNHIPLTRHTPFSYGAGSAGAGGFESAVFTHKAGWGHEEAYGGAPFDSAFALRGMGGGLTSGPGHTVGLGDKHTGHRSDIEHNAVGTGIGTGTTTGGLGHDRDHHFGTGNRDGVRDTYGTSNTYNTTPGLTSNTTHHTPGLTSGTTHHTPGLTSGTTHHTPGLTSGTTHHNPSLMSGTTHTPGLTSGTTHHTPGLTSGLTSGNTHHTSGLTSGTTHHTPGLTSGTTHHTSGLTSGTSYPTTGTSHTPYNTTSGLTSGLTHGTTGNTHHTSGIMNPTSTHDTYGRGDHLTSTRDGGLTHHDGLTHNDDFDREGRSTTVGDNRYRSHRKSLERKALAAQARDENRY